MITITRYPNLGLIQFAPGAWRFLQRDEITDPFIGAHSVGPIYHSKTEALCDLDRYAKEWGY